MFVSSLIRVISAIRGALFFLNELQKSTTSHTNYTNSRQWRPSLVVAQIDLGLGRLIFFSNDSTLIDRIRRGKNSLSPIYKSLGVSNEPVYEIHRHCLVVFMHEQYHCC
jgi:hypothetical protein